MTMRKISSKWIPKYLNVDQKKAKICVPFEKDKNFLSDLVTFDETQKLFLGEGGGWEDPFARSPPRGVVLTDATIAPCLPTKVHPINQTNHAPTMAYTRPKDMDGFYAHLSKPDTKFRQQVGTDLLTFLAEPSNPIDCQDIGLFVDGIIPWMQSSNYKGPFLPSSSTLTLPSNGVGYPIEGCSGLLGFTRATKPVIAHEAEVICVTKKDEDKLRIIETKNS
ncbi:unnamed protein product [Diabrotica balteata]|uniref:Uncharacterized protein n=1 Tax=Diabrotica balteata TaxID=107213 RepID=A0A9N9T5P9_DIABA|nr:unnamed protein product [Diabrotica balteata]